MTVADAPCANDPDTPTSPAYWNGSLLLFNGSSSTRSIGIVQMGSASDHGSFERFVDAMRTKRIADATDKDGNLRYESLQGDTLEFGVAGVVPYKE